MKMSRSRHRSGQAFLSLALLVGTLLLLVAGTLVFLVGSFVDTSYGDQASNQAQVVASAGVEDAMLQLERNSLFSSAGYAVRVASTTATVSVTQNSPQPNEISILSVATVANRTRKINAIFSKNALTNQLVKVLWTNVP